MLTSVVAAAVVVIGKYRCPLRLSARKASQLGWAFRAWRRTICFGSQFITAEIKAEDLLNIMVQGNGT